MLPALQCAPENVAKKQSPYGSSGPFGDETDGPWRQMKEVAFTWLALILATPVILTLSGMIGLMCIAHANKVWPRRGSV